MEEQKKKKNLWVNIAIVVVVLLTGLTIIGSLSDFNKVLEIIKTADIMYILIALLLSALGLFLLALSNQIILRAINKDLPYKTGFLIQSVEAFFNGITPFSSGAQPFQVYFYNKHHVKPEQSTSVVLVSSILYQIACVVLSTLGLIFFWQPIAEALGNTMIFLMVGYGINAAVLVMLFLMAYIKGFKSLITALLTLIGKIKFLNKKMNNLMKKSDTFVSNFQDGVKFLFTKKRVFILSLLTKFVSLIITYLTTIFILRSLGIELNIGNNIYIIAASLLAATSMFFIPLPGASGGTEAIFAGMTAFLFTSTEMGLTVMILWRAVTYYFGMLYGLVHYLILQRTKVKEL